MECNVRYNTVTRSSVMLRCHTRFLSNTSPIRHLQTTLANINGAPNRLKNVRQTVAGGRLPQIGHARYIYLYCGLWRVAYLTSANMSPRDKCFNNILHLSPSQPPAVHSSTMRVGASTSIQLLHSSSFIKELRNRLHYLEMQFV